MRLVTLISAVLVLVSCVNLERPPFTDRGKESTQDLEETVHEEIPSEKASTDQVSESPSTDAAASPKATETEDSGEKPEKSSDPIVPKVPEPRRVRPLTMPQILRSLEKVLPPDVHVVSRSGEPLLDLKDIDLDELPEVIVPGAVSEEDLDGDILSDFSSLYETKRKAHPFVLYILSMSDERLVVAERVDFGPRFVFGGLSRLSIRKGRPAPFVITVTFQTLEGQEQEWLVFNGKSLKPISQFSFQESFSTSIVIEDIDGDSYIDIVTQEKAAEEGVGMETFLTWYKWDRKKFAEYKTANVVRSLKDFLSRIRVLMLDGEWDELVEESLLPSEVEAYRRRNWKSPEILLEAFGLGTFFEDDTRPADEILTGVADIVFPDFLENPFLVRDEEGVFFRLSFRVVDAYGFAYISEVPIYMAKNPFTKRQFYVSIPSDI